MLIETEFQGLMECPNCGKKSLVQLNSDRYHCLWCDFHRDLSSPQAKETIGLIPLSIMTTIVFILLLL